MALFTRKMFGRTSPFTQQRQPKLDVTTPTTQIAPSRAATTTPTTTTTTPAPVTTQPAATTQAAPTSARTYQGVSVDQWWTQHAKSYQDAESRRTQINAQYAPQISELDRQIEELRSQIPSGSQERGTSYRVIQGQVNALEGERDALVKERDNAMSAVFNPATATPTILYADDGSPLAQGYWVGSDFYVNRDLRNLGGLLDEAGAVDIPSYTEWMGEKGYETQDVTESQAWQGLQNLIADIQAPETQAEWQAGGLNWAEQLLGMEPGQYGGTLQDLLSGMNETRARDPFALTDTQERSIATSTADLREEMKLIVESLGASGRNIQALVSADEMASQIANEAINQRITYANFNFAKNEADYAALQQRYQMMVQTGVMTASEYIARQREHAALQLTMYANEVSMIESANAQYLMEYQADLAGMQAAAQQIYNQINMTLGVDSALLEQANQWYEMMLAPITLQMQQAALALEQQKADAADRNALWGSVLDLLGTGVSALLGNWGDLFPSEE